MKTRPLTLAVPILLVLLANGCGGGGGGGGSTPPPAPPATPSPPPAPTDPLGDVGSKEEEQDRLFEAVGSDVVAPAYAELKSEADALDQAVETYCGAPTADQSSVEDAWREAMLAWQRVQHIAVGPIETDNRRFRLQFFPDNNEAVERGVDQALAGTDPLTETVIASRSVGIQGLPALEYLVFGIGDLDNADEGPRRCELAEAITANVATIAGEVSDAWAEDGAFIDDFVNARGDFMERDDVLVAILEAMGAHAEFIGDRKLNPARRAQSGPELLLESHYAAHSAENISANIEGFEAMFESDADDVYRLRDYLERVHSADSITGQLDDQLTAADTHIAGFEGSLEDVFAGRATGDSEGLYEAVQEIADLIVDAAVEAGVELGFNNQDGD